MPLKASGPRDTGADRWAATDALGRSLPTFAQVGPPRASRFVGVFYFLWLGEHGTAGPFDITQILAQDRNVMQKPDSPLWGPLGVPHHWGKSVFGYYRSDDPWVLRRHAQLLSDAGVDTVIFDVTNNLTYPRSYHALCRVWSQIRREGGRTPQIAFLCPFGNAAPVVEALYDDLYGPGLYKDLWFEWQGKPLLLADPATIRPEQLRASQRVPGQLEKGNTYGQSFTATKLFTQVGGAFPTYHTTTSGMTLSLYAAGADGGPGGKRLLRRTFANLHDNDTVLLKSDRPLPAGRYYLEMSDPVGTVGWWSETRERYDAGRAWQGSAPQSGDRSIIVQYVGDTAPTPLLNPAGNLTAKQAQARAERIRSFFTFRKPQPDYFVGQNAPNEWGWLEVYPQKPFGTARDNSTRPEELPVGVAQNAVDGHLSVLSHPRSLGRSYQASAAQPGLPNYMGRNFAEQWERALQLDPDFVFVTGWNEWIAGRFGADAPFYGAGPVSFVDQFDHEHSRDIEPVVDGHTDSYYYQFVSYVRRYKGVRLPTLPAAPLSQKAAISIDGRFGGWASVGTAVGAVYEDDRFDTLPRDHPAWNPQTLGRYRNTTGRNDLTTLKVAHDAQTVYFYARTREPIRGAGLPGAMVLTVQAAGKTWSNQPTRPQIRQVVRGNELEIAVPRSALGLAPNQPFTLTFKWRDNVNDSADPLNLYRNGDTAPNSRFAYVYQAAQLPAPKPRTFPPLPAGTSVPKRPRSVSAPLRKMGPHTKQ